MKAFAICLFVAVGVVHVNAGGYVLKGGVVDFGKPLDYFDQAVQAGETLFLVFNLNLWAQCYETFYGRNLRVFIIS